MQTTARRYTHRMSRGDVIEVRDEAGNVVATITMDRRKQVIVRGEEVRIHVIKKQC